MRKLIIICLLLISTNLWGTTYYVTQAGTGDGSAVGTPDSIADFNLNVFGDLTDDTVVFTGAFTTALNTPAGCLGTANDHRVTLDLSGATWGATATYQMLIDQAYVTVSGGSLAVADTGAVPTAIYVTGENVIIDGATITGAGAAATIQNSSGIWLAAGGTYMAITDCTISHTCVGIWVRGAGFAGTIGGVGHGNTISNCDAIPIGNADGIDVNGEGDWTDYAGLTISYNTISEWMDDGIDLYYGLNVVVEYNEVGPFSSASESITDGNGIKCGSNNSTGGNIVRYNYIHDIQGASGYNYGITTNGSDSITIHHNLVIDAYYGLWVTGNSTSHSIYNNTFYACRYRGASFGDNTLLTTFQNNICDGDESYDLLVNAGCTITGGWNIFKTDASSKKGTTYTDAGDDDLYATDPVINATTGQPSSTSPGNEIDTGEYYYSGRYYWQRPMFQ